MSRLRKAAKATAVIQVFNWVGLVLSLVTVPLYMQWLGQERYGILLTGLAFSSYLMFSDAGVNWASMLLIAQANGSNDRERIVSIVRNSFPLTICSGMIVTIAVAGINFFAIRIAHAGWLPDHPEVSGLLIVIGASVVINLCISPFYNLLIGLQESDLAGIYQGSGRIAGTLIAVGIAFSGAPLSWVYGGNVAGATVAGLLAAVHCVRRHRWAFMSGPIWESDQIRQQLRTGAKSLTTTVGIVLWGTAPIFAISTGAGPEYVPFYSIPMTLLNAPLSVLSSYSANLQPGYGEAMGLGETKWIASTVERLLRQVTIALGLLGIGFMLLAQPFVALWTGGRIYLSHTMLASVLAIAATGALLTVLRYALTGINRHRITAVADLLCGALAMMLSLFVVREFGYEWIGCSMVFAPLISTGWIFPRQLSHNLGSYNILPGISFWLRLALTTLVSALVGCCALLLTKQGPILIVLSASGIATTAAFYVAGCLLLNDETQMLKLLMPAYMRKETIKPDNATAITSKICE